MCRIGPCSRSLEQTMVPRTKQVGVVPHREHIIGKVGRWIATDALTRTARNIHKQVTLLVGVFHQAVFAIQDSTLLNVRTHKSNIRSLNTCSLKFSLCRIVATVLQSLIEKVQQSNLIKSSEIINRGCCRWRHTRLRICRSSQTSQKHQG